MATMDEGHDITAQGTTYLVSTVSIAYRRPRYYELVVTTSST